MPLQSLGPFSFSSGVALTKIDGPKRDEYVIEHAVPAREGGIVEYLGSMQSTYQLKGMLAADATGQAGAVLSGAGYYGVNSDDALSFLRALRGSGALLLQLQSTSRSLYENGFFYISKQTFGMEAGRGYPYYLFTLDLKGASPAAYGNSSGATVFGSAAEGFFSGFIRISQLGSAGTMTKGEVINTVGVNVLSAASGNIKLALYDAIGPNLLAQSASQPVHSGFNYFPFNPSYQTAANMTYYLAIKGDATTASGFTIGYIDEGAGSNESDFISGQAFASDFPASLTLHGTLSGYFYDLWMVTL